MSSPQSATRRPRGPADPGRADRIARAAIRVVTADGIQGLTHRAVARAAKVPVSSTTYYFNTREDLIAAAMKLASRDYADEVGRCSAGWNEEKLADELAAFVARTTVSRAQRKHLVIGFELCLAALRVGTLRPISAEWDGVLLKVLRRHLPADVALSVHAAASGLWWNAVVSDAPVTIEQATAVLAPIIASADA